TIRHARSAGLSAELSWVPSRLAKWTGKAVFPIRRLTGREFTTISPRTPSTADRESWAASSESLNRPSATFADSSDSPHRSREPRLIPQRHPLLARDPP